MKNLSLSIFKNVNSLMIKLYTIQQLLYLPIVFINFNNLDTSRVLISIRETIYVVYVEGETENFNIEICNIF